MGKLLHQGVVSPLPAYKPNSAELETEREAPAGTWEWLSTWSPPQQMEKSNKYPFLAVPTYLLLRHKAPWAYRWGVGSSALGTDPILAVPRDTRTNRAECSIQDSLALTSVPRAPNARLCPARSLKSVSMRSTLPHPPFPNLLALGTQCLCIVRSELLWQPSLTRPTLPAAVLTLTPLLVDIYVALQKH